MKKAIITTVLLATLTAVNAQDKGQPTKATQNPAISEKRANERAAQEADPLVAQLGLSADQATKLTSINEQHTKAIKELQSAGLQGEALAARSAVLNANYERNMQGLLTPEQFEKWNAQRRGAPQKGQRATPAK